MTLTEAYQQLARAALADGVRSTFEDDYGGPVLRAWIRQHVIFRPDTEFFIVVGVARELGKIQPELPPVQLPLWEAA